MKPKKAKSYNPELELAKGATLDAASYDKTHGKITVGGISDRAEISSLATKNHRCRLCGEEYEKRFNDDGYCPVCLG